MNGPDPGNVPPVETLADETSSNPCGTLAKGVLEVAELINITVIEDQP